MRVRKSGSNYFIEAIPADKLEIIVDALKERRALCAKEADNAELKAHIMGPHVDFNEHRENAVKWRARRDGAQEILNIVSKESDKAME